jgi:hypothetical protein
MDIYMMKKLDSSLSSTPKPVFGIYKADRFRDFKPLVKKSSPGELHFLSFKDVESRVGPDWGAP